MQPSLLNYGGEVVFPQSETNVAGKLSICHIQRLSGADDLNNYAPAQSQLAH